MKDKLDYMPQSTWNIYSDNKSQKNMENIAKRYIDFLTKCKTERETISYVKNILLKQDFTENFADKNVMRVLRNKAIFAAKRGKKSLENGLLLIAAHADTPRLDFKQRPLIEQPTIAQAKTHYYGGIRKYQWLARPLAIHGVIVKSDGKILELNIGEKDDDPVFCISDLLPHLAQKQNELTIRDAFEGEKLNIVLGHSHNKQDKKETNGIKDIVKQKVLEILHKKYLISEEDLISAEIQVVPAGPARFVGFDKSLIGGYGQDDRICVFTALEAFLKAKSDQNIAVIFWDKEEIGSDGATGASSRFLQYCVEDLAREDKNLFASQVFMNTRAISADVQAALDPDFPEVHEKQNAAQLGFGPCFSKFTGSRGKYGASDADAEFFGSIRNLFNKHKIPWQVAECGKVDLGRICILFMGVMWTH